MVFMHILIFVFNLSGSGRLSDKLLHESNTHIGVIIWKEHSSYTKSDLHVKLSPNILGYRWEKEPTFFELENMSDRE